MSEKFKQRRTQVLSAPASTQDTTHSLYASARTLSDIDWLAERLPQIAKADLIVISPDDLKNGTGVELKNLLKNIVPADVYKHLEQEHTSKQWDELAQSTRDGASALSFDFNRDGKNDIGIIVTGDTKRTPQQFFSTLTNIPVSKLQNIPGTSYDYLAMTLYHEAAHVTQPRLNSRYAEIPLPYEIDADQKGIMAYRQDLENGYPLNPEVLDAVIDARIGSTLANRGGMLESIKCLLDGQKSTCGMPSHTTHIGLTESGISDGLPTPLNASKEELQGMMIVKSFVNGAQGHAYIMQTMQDYMKDGKMPADSKDYFKDALDMLTKFRNPLAIAEIGQDIAAKDPMGSKAIIDRLDSAGFFDNVQGASTYLDRIHSFFDRYTPDYKSDPSYMKMAEQMAQIPEDFLQKIDLKDAKAVAPAPSAPNQEMSASPMK